MLCLLINYYTDKSDELPERDRGTLESGDIRWRNTAQWARNDMRNQGLLAATSPTGIWEITQRGQTYLQEQGE
jgi:hypothetical protein